MKRPRALRIALQAISEAGLVVAGIVEGSAHTRIRLTNGEVLLVSRGARQTNRMEFLLRRDLNRAARRSATRHGTTVRETTR
jgi:hypothetical protein